MAKGVAKDAFANSGTANNYSGMYSKSGQDVNNTLFPFLQGEVNNPEGFGQQTLDQMLTHGGESVAGAVGNAKESAELNASRTGNTANLSSIIDAAARSGMSQQSNNALDVDIANAKLKQEQQQAGASGLNSLYGTDVKAALESLGLSNQALGVANQADANTFNQWQGIIGDVFGAAKTGLTAGSVGGFAKG
jgi:hypothetical protein